MNGKRVIEYPPVGGSLEEMKAQFQEQLKDFNKRAEAGEIICLTDLIGNAERIHMAQVEKTEKEARR
jgi:mannose/fructose-specific phosphotransferase system component IIA